MNLTDRNVYEQCRWFLWRDDIFAVFYWSAHKVSAIEYALVKQMMFEDVEDNKFEIQSYFRVIVVENIE